MNLSPTRIASHGLWLAGACLQWGAIAAEASPSIWRCGNTYTDVPCQAGQSLEADDARSPAQQREADQATRAARAEAQRMERDRQRLEATQRPAVLIDNAPKPRTAAAPAPMLRKTGVRKDPLYVNPGETPASRRKRGRLAGGERTEGRG
ncbi:hypothetical protein QTH87_08310 [Variovorax sp. J22P168]|uniref:hypothetical protein n=1 Tax=Variovorax jilinensis TaxID=3053513 RepID=UPI0025750B83|nr:hypothetical protein [Variovorax sp. J22P168]MDM0012436.1 hypothetical protein [Variovorax sp. J22P168]